MYNTLIKAGNDMTWILSLSNGTKLLLKIAEFEIQWLRVPT